MNAPTTLRPDVDLSDAYMDLKSQIRDLTHMAELAQFHAINTFRIELSRRNLFLGGEIQPR